MKRPFIPSLSTNVFAAIRTIESTYFNSPKRYSLLEPLRCATEVPDSFQHAARFGLRMLLLPFRVEIEWVDKHDLRGPSIYYGTAPEGLPEDTLCLGCVTSTLEFFRQSNAFPTVSRYVKVHNHRIPVLFDGTGTMTFDPVASVFFYLSGWQEAYTIERDEHGRFPYEASIQHALGNPELPVADWYRHIVAETLRKKGAIIQKKQWNGASWAFCSTHDIDYDKKWRPGIYKREILDRLVLNQNKESIHSRLARATSALHSVFDTDDPFRAAFVRMQHEVLLRGGKATYFLKSGGKGKRDVSYSLQDPFVYEQLVQLHNNGFEIGLHPSYHAMLNREKLASEKAKLEAVCGFSSQTHRAHYLRVDMPRSGHDIAESGFTIDSSLGFATRGGFRHGTCLPFPLYDPKNQSELGVWEMPLVLMESALFNRMNVSLEQADAITKGLMEVVSGFGGVMVGLWHNTLWDEVDFPGWGDHFIHTLDEAKRLKGGMDTLKSSLEHWK